MSTLLPESGHRKTTLRYVCRSSFGSLAIFAAIHRATRFLIEINVRYFCDTYDLSLPKLSKFRPQKGVLRMGILDELLAGGQRQNEYKDFVNRYEQGAPSEGYSDQEVLKRYGEVSHAVPPDQYAQAAQEALSKLSPEERAAFVKMLQDRAAARGVTLPRNVAPEPKDLGQVLTDLHAKPGQLRDMLGGGAAQPQGQASGSSAITDILTSPMAKAVLAGIAAMVVKRVMGQSRAA